MRELEPGPRALGFLLGLGDLNRTVCLGYANGCVSCLDCRERALGPSKAPEPIRQPWEMAA